MDGRVKQLFEDLNAGEDQEYQAFCQILEEISKPVEWAYDIWDEQVVLLTQGDNHQRSRASQILSHLAISDPEKRIVRDFEKILDVTRDPKFVTARHCLQSIWRIGLAGEKQKHLVVDALIERFAECEDEKNHTLIRFDIMEGLRKLYNATKDENIKSQSVQIMDLERDEKHKHKYDAVWRKK